MLNNDNSIYTFKSMEDILTFENVHEKIIKIHKVCVKL